MNNNYVYILISSIDNIPFYVGLGKGNRMKTHRSCALSGKNPHGNAHLGNKIRKLISEGGDVIYKKEVDNVSREDAKRIEILKIKEYGRKDKGLGTLCNMTDGGDDGGGFRLTDEQKMRAKENSRITMKNLSEEKRKHISDCVKSFYKSESTEKREARIEKLRISAKNQIRPNNLGELIRAGQNPKNMVGNKKITWTDREKEALSLAHKQSPKCQDWLKSLHQENRETGRMRGENSKCFIQYDKDIIKEIIYLYEKGWGYSRIRSYLTKIKGIQITRSVIINRIQNSGIQLRKVLTNFDNNPTIEENKSTT